MSSKATASTHLQDLRAELAQTAAAPDDAPRSLPGRFYTDQTLFEHECKGVLQDGWHCVGRADALPNTGDFQAITLLNEPIIITRSGDQIRALSNVCRHRGMPLVEGTGNVERFVCRYHAWTYGTDGALLRAPRMKNAGFDLKTCRLGEFPCLERFGFVYVSLSNTPSDLDTQVEGLDDLIGVYEPQKYRLAHAASEVWRTNWKSLVENFMEGYHLSVVHPQTLHGYTPTGLSEKAASGPGFTSYHANYPDDIPFRGHGAPGLSAVSYTHLTLPTNREV